MSNITIEEICYKNFGKCLKICNEIIEVIVTTDFGPRIIRYSFIDGDNVFYEDTDRIIKDERTKNTFFDTWYLYGGHRLWIAPENFPDTYYPDNFLIDYKVINNGAVFTAPVQKHNNCRIEISLILSPDTTDVKVMHTLTNCSDSDIKLSLWGVSVVDGGGIEIIPQPTENKIYSPNRKIVFWPASKLYDKRASWGDKYIKVQHRSDMCSSFKFGLNSEHGFALYLNKGDIFTKKFDIIKNGIYPDEGASYESYANGHYIEMESLSEYKVIPPQKSITHCEYWKLSKGTLTNDFDEAEIENLIQKIF
ncbi:MAG: hypothetical protein E7392_01460 [Ruminococcaceae bacterium]|nr:hypothetical protein [Oscillospiraceae bacterium]